MKPIIHNIQPGQPGYSECQLYNNLLAAKPKGPGLLASKIAMQRSWKELCKQAYEKAELALIDNMINQYGTGLAG